MMGRLLNRRAVLGFCALIFLLAFFNSYLASTHPDGLERVAEDLNFLEHAKDSFSVFGDYELPIGGALLRSGLAGVLGVGLTCAVLLVIGKLLVPGKGK